MLVVIMINRVGSEPKALNSCVISLTSPTSPSRKNTLGKTATRINIIQRAQKYEPHGSEFDIITVFPPYLWMLIYTEPYSYYVFPIHT